MATLLPPPKRQKVYHGVPEPEPEAPKPSPNVVVQFVSEENGEPLAPAVNLPANVSREGLEALVNKLNTKVNKYCSVLPAGSLACIGQDEDPVPFSFHIALPPDATTPGAPTQLVITKSIQEDVLAHPSHAFTPEDVFVVRCSPQAVFKVRPATRCSSTLSGTLPHLRSPCHAHRSPIIRSHVSDPMCLFLAYGQPACHRIRGLQCPAMGPIHGDAIPCPIRSQGLGALRRMGSDGTQTRYGWSRRSCSSVGSKGGQAHRRRP